jgi:hypothetical protein
MITAGCGDDRQVVGVGTGATGGLPSPSGGQTVTLAGAGGNSTGTGSGLGGTSLVGPGGNTGGAGTGLGGAIATGGVGGTSLVGSGGITGGVGSGVGGAIATGGVGGTSLVGSGGNSAGAGSSSGGTKTTGGVGGKSSAGSGGNTTGASSGSGGTKATGGAAGAAGTIVDETCTAGPVQLLLTTSTPSAYCLQSCGGFVSILTSDGQPFTSLSTDPCNLTPLCSTCSAPACTDVFCGPMVMSRSSAGVNWQGAYREADTCGQNVACSHGRCITSGHYIARFCATAASSTGTCDSSGARTCVEAPFDFPTTATVQAQLPAIGGAAGSPAGGSASTGGSTGTGGTVGSGGTGATGGTIGSGGGTGTAVAAGGVCNSGCTQEGTGTESPWCATPNATLVCQGPYPSDLATIMSANGCANVPTGAVRYCCPIAILTQCQ